MKHQIVQTPGRTINPKEIIEEFADYLLDIGAVVRGAEEGQYQSRVSLLRLEELLWEFNEARRKAAGLE